MRKALTIIMGLLIAGILSLYILGASPSQVFKKLSESSAQASILRLGEDIENTPSPLQGQQPADTAQKTNADENVNAPASYAPLAPPKKTGTDEDGWKMVWSDEFDEEVINPGCWAEVSRTNNFNNELQCYLSENSYLEDGSLCLTARKEKANGKEYSSAMIETLNKLTLCYGRIEARIELPVGQGLFPAFWLLSEHEGEEIDIMEMIGSDPDTFYGVNHYDNGKKTYGTVINNTPQEYHVYALDWEPDGLKWYIDGNCFLQTTEGIPSADMYIILNLAVGGDWPGAPDDTTVFPATMLVDYIRIYKHT